ncbi:MAG: hypothetical protein MJ237_00665 [bacterium]|nr:hypothetical protein [bacterium]
MYQIKSRIYLYFDKTQKSAVCNYLRALVKQNLKLNCEQITDKFIEDEKYYLKLNVSRFPYISEFIENSEFLNDTKAYVSECLKYYLYKESQKPFVEAQKEFEKKKRKFLQEVKMSKELPTKKQLYYYEKLCKRYDIEQKDTENLSKLDLRDEIERILNDHEKNCETSC